MPNAVMKQNKDRKGYAKFSLYGGYFRTQGVAYMEWRS